MNVAIIADDLTGAADSGVQLVRSGYRTAVVFHDAPFPPAEDLDAVAVETDSRSLEPQLARERVLKAGREIKEARIVYKKIDSTLRGPVAAEISAALEATGRERVVVAPAFPSAGRTTRDGVQLVHGEPVHETELSKDPRTPVREGHIPSLLSGALPAATLSVADLEDLHSVRSTLGGAGCVIADAGADTHLEALVQAVPDPSSVLWVGSAGLALALGSVYPGPQADASPRTDPPASGVLAVVGSVNEVAREQLRRLAGEPGVVPVPLDTAALIAGSFKGAVGEAVVAVRSAFSCNRGATLYSAAGEEVDSAIRDGSASEYEVAGLVADALAEVVARASDEALFDALVMTGGATAVRVGLGLGATGILLRGELEPGVPTGTLRGPRPYRVVTKAGGFGGPDTLHHAFHALTGTRKEQPA